MSRIEFGFGEGDVKRMYIH